MDGTTNAGKVRRPPGPELYRILAHRDITWFKANAELIDNAFDAAATRCEIEMYGKQFSVSDDGNGCQDVLLIVQPAERSSHETTKSGAYGIGSKEALSWIASEDGRIWIASTYRNKRYSVKVDLAHYASHNWELDLPTIDDNPSLRGTRIEVPNPVHDPPVGERLEQLKTKLSFYYSPAMRAGKQILIRTGTPRKPITTTLTPFQHPPFEEFIEDTLTVDGRKIQLLVGITKQGVTNAYPGLAYVHEWRVIKRSDNGEGCSGISTARIFGTVQIVGHEWTLTTDKANIVRADTLYQAVQERCRDLYAKVRTLAEKIELDSLKQAVNQELNAMLSFPRREPTLKAKRIKPENHSGPIVPVHSDRKHTRAEKLQRGNTFGGASVSCGSAQVEWGFLGPGKIGECHRDGDTFRVTLNLDIPRITVERDNGDIRAAAWCAGLLIARNQASQREPLLEPQSNEVFDNLARLMGGPCGGLEIVKQVSA